MLQVLQELGVHQLRVLDQMLLQGPVDLLQIGRLVDGEDAHEENERYSPQSRLGSAYVADGFIQSDALRSIEQRLHPAPSSRQTRDRTIPTRRSFRARLGAARR